MSRKLWSWSDDESWIHRLDNSGCWMSPDEDGSHLLAKVIKSPPSGSYPVPPSPTSSPPPIQSSIEFRFSSAGNWIEPRMANWVRNHSLNEALQACFNDSSRNASPCSGFWTDSRCHAQLPLLPCLEPLTDARNRYWIHHKLILNSLKVAVD